MTSRLERSWQGDSTADIGRHPPLPHRPPPPDLLQRPPDQRVRLKHARGGTGLFPALPGEHRQDRADALGQHRARCSRPRAPRRAARPRRPRARADAAVIATNELGLQAGSPRAGPPRARRSPPRRGSAAARRRRRRAARRARAGPATAPRPMPGRDGQVDRVALARAAARVAQRAPCPGYRGDWWMLANSTSRGASEDLGGAVAVVHVPVEHEHALQAELGDRRRRPRRRRCRTGRSPSPGRVRRGGPDGRTPQKPTSASPASSARVISQAPPAACSGGLVGARARRTCRRRSRPPPAAHSSRIARTCAAIVDQLELRLARGRRQPALPAEPVALGERTPRARPAARACRDGPARTAAGRARGTRGG